MKWELSNEAWRTYIKIISTDRTLNFSMKRSIRLRGLANRAYSRYIRRRDAWMISSLQLSWQISEDQFIAGEANVNSHLVAKDQLIEGYRSKAPIKKI